MAPVFPTPKRTLELAASAVLVAVGLAIVLVARVGPVVLTVAEGRGVHFGDSFGVLAAMGALWLVARPSAGEADRIGVDRSPAHHRPRLPVVLDH
jgi:hypothetical protein